MGPQIFSASVAGSFSGNNYTTPEIPFNAVQLHCVILYEGLARRVELGAEYAEGTISRDVREGGAAITSRTPTLAIRRRTEL